MLKFAALEDALWSKRLNGIISFVYRNERPLLGLAGFSDWISGGTISSFLRKGVFTGQENENTYIPVNRSQGTHHFLLFGMGPNDYAGHRKSITRKQISEIEMILAELKLTNLGISLQDAGFPERDPKDLGFTEGTNGLLYFP